MHLLDVLPILTLLSCSAWRPFVSAFPDQHLRSSFRADVGHGENVHIPDDHVGINPDQEANTFDLVQESDPADFEHITVQSSTDPPSNRTHHDDHAIHVASWQWEYVRTPFIYTAVVIMAGFCKIGFHHAEFLSSILPESCMLIVLGTIVGTIVHFTESREMLPQFTPKAFFLFLLPPIVLESAYSLHDRAFFSNLGTIILYAVIGTILNCFIIGLCLYGLTYIDFMGDLHLHLVECLVFSALISAVDPVAVLAIFQEVGVNKNLYFLVFGESLLNDAVTIVLYMMMVSFSKAEYITAEQVCLGVAAFISVSLGGLAIGVLMGLLTAIITKHTKEVRVVEPLAMLGVAYLSYLLAEMVHFSGIISIIGCGIVQAHYASKNISRKSNTTVKYFTKMVSAVCDTVIFLFLGMVLVDDTHLWHTGFVFWCTTLCLVVRFASVFFLTYCANKVDRSHRIDEEEQFIMAYGGLRGAVSFSLVIMLDDIEHKELFITATLFIILFTVFVQGATIKPIVSLLKIRKQGAKDTSSLFTEVNKKLLDHVMAGVEEITGDHGGNYWKQLLFHYNSKYLRRWLVCESTQSNLTRVYTQMMLEDHFAHLYGPFAAIQDRKPLLLNKIPADEAEDVLVVLPLVTVEGVEETQDNTVKGEAEEGRPLKNKRNSDTSALPMRPSLLKRRTTLASIFSRPPEDDASKLLQKALLHNPFNKLHQKYNPNLVDEEDQDIDVQLRKRRLRTRRLTLLAMRTNNSENLERKGSLIPDREALIAHPLAPLTASPFLLKRGQKKIGFRKEPSSPKADAAVELGRRRDVKDWGTGGVATIGEEDETDAFISGSTSADSDQENPAKYKVEGTKVGPSNREATAVVECVSQL